MYSYSPKALVAAYQKLKDDPRLLTLPGSPVDGSTGNDDDDAMDTGGKATNNHKVGQIVVAATQLSGSGLPTSDMVGYCFRAEQAIERAVEYGANLILLPELWCGPYFCQSQETDLLNLADEIDISSNILIRRMQALSKLHDVVLPVSIYERCNNALYNSVVVIDADGRILGTYRKSHIPDGTGYQEKFYFTPGDSGFKVFDTKVGKVGVAICWDQWQPEAARAMSLMGAEVLLYPTAIGSEPQDSTLNSVDHWQRAMMGHAASNMVPVVASNRYGVEVLLDENSDETSAGDEKQRIKFYGRSFITDNVGAKIAECPDNTDEEPIQVIVATIDAEQNRKDRAAWGMFRDRRPDLYNVLLTKDGKT